MSFELTIAREDDEAERGGNKLDYLPFGVKTLKVEVKGDYEGKLRLRPRRFSPVAGERFAHEDEGEPPQFVVSWGGGHEDYYELDYPKKRFVHFLVQHVGKNMGDHKLTIEAEDEQGQVTSLPVTLTYPLFLGSPPPQDQLVQPYWKQVREGLQGSCDIQLRGDLAPRYISRWWPENKVRYTSDQPPQVRIRYRRLVDDVNGELTVYAAQNKLAVIRGSIGYPLYDMRQVLPELYRFGSQTWVLRIWFFWLDLDISRQDLGRYWQRKPDELEEAWRGITSKAAGGLAEQGWYKEHEIPDAERADIVFDDDLQPLYAAIDLHWREMWGAYKPKNVGDPVQVQIMNTKLQELADNWQETRKVIEGWGTIFRSQLAGHKTPYKPHEKVLRELMGAVPFGVDPIKMQSHSPALFNIELQSDLTSTDVTDG